MSIESIGNLNMEDLPPLEYSEQQPNFRTKKTDKGKKKYPVKVSKEIKASALKLGIPLS